MLFTIERVIIHAFGRGFGLGKATRGTGPTWRAVWVLFPVLALTRSSPAIAQTPPTRVTVQVPASDGERLVKVEKIRVEGSRLEASSVQMLTGLRPGQQINETSLRKAIERMLDSGLVKNVDYSYESMSSPRSVLLELRIEDESPLLPASIQLPGVEQENVWAYLKSVDPLFTRELPRTQKALAFYTRYMERYLYTLRRQDRIASVITADDSGEASGIVFVPASLMGTPQFRKKN